MNRCSLCMTELHPEAVACIGCHATKVRVRKKAGILRGIGILGFSVIGLFLLMAGKYLVGFGLMGVAWLLASTTPWETKWVKSI